MLSDSRRRASRSDQVRGQPRMTGRIGTGVAISGATVHPSPGPDFFLGCAGLRPACGRDARAPGRRYPPCRKRNRRRRRRGCRSETGVYESTTRSHHFPPRDIRMPLLPFGTQAGRGFSNDLHRLENGELTPPILREFVIRQPFRERHGITCRNQHVHQTRRVVTPHGSLGKTRGSPACGCGFGCLRRRRE